MARTALVFCFAVLFLPSSKINQFDNLQMRILQNRMIHLFYTLINQENSRAKIYFTYPLPFREGIRMDIYSVKLDIIYSLFMRAILDIEISLGHSASQLPVLVQLPKPSSSIWATILCTR